MPDRFHRLGQLPPYVFAEVAAMKAAAMAEGHPIIDLSIGSPDSSPPKHVTDTLIEHLRDPGASGYSLTPCSQEVRVAQADYYQRRFGVTLDPAKEIVVTIGSKEGLASLMQVITSPGDSVIVPDPCYPIHRLGFVLAGASTIIAVPNHPDSRMLDAAKKALETEGKKPIAMVVNFPCNPTAECVSDLGFYEEVVALCRHHGIYVISDIAYGEIYFGDNPPPSILQVKGAKDVAIEFSTVSKAFSMAGWRIGFGVGNPTLVGALIRIKSYLDYGTFLPIQKAAAAALTGKQDYVAEMRGLYKARRDVLVRGLHDAGWDVPVPDASMFLWAPLPEKHRHLGSLEFSKLLFRETGVAVAPGTGFGEGGEGFVRIALVEGEAQMKKATDSIKRFLA